MNRNPSNSSAENEVSLKELFLRIQKFYQEVLKNWKLVLLVPIPFVILFLIQAFRTPVIYPAKLTFMINDSNGGGANGVGALLGQFGFGGTGNGVQNLDKMLALSKSRKILQQVLLSKIDEDGKVDYLANNLIRAYDLHETWREDTTGMATFLFTHDKISNFSKLENKVLLKLFKILVGGENSKGIVSTAYGKETGIMLLVVKTVSESLSINIAETVFQELSTFYVEKSIEKQKQTYDIILSKTDSIKGLLDYKESALSSFNDSNRALWTVKSQLKQKQLRRDVEVLNRIYIETLKNLEIADFNLKSQTPVVQEIDNPIYPIKPDKKSKLIAIILGGVIGGIVGIGFIILRKIYRDTMDEET